ncbi:hypothetical protein [Lacticaseibacillus porcinae]|uniref:hypothetical protein n=1 Tax=Lacticaseibacillus porcinae TaxID=1123687 RepID=UPI000F7797CB|nr:hypothetical protein [Lacticaseibacillus porcinae]
MHIEALNRLQAAEYVKWHYFGDASNANLNDAEQVSEFTEIFADNGLDYFAVLVEDELVGVLSFEFPNGQITMSVKLAPQAIGMLKTDELVQLGSAFGQAHYHDDDAVQIASVSPAED